MPEPLTDRDLDEEFEKIMVEQPTHYILASLFRLIKNKNSMVDKEVIETLEAIKGGWY